MRIVFFGSDEFAAVHLEHLLKAGQEVLCCVTGPDKPQGRGMKLAASPIKEMALLHQIPYLQPGSLKEHGIVQALKSYHADIFVVVAYGRLLTQEILDIPKIFCLNVHGSLLPQYRGAAPINWAILNGNKETGVTIQKMALKLDAGDIIAQERMAIGANETAGQLRQRMSLAGAELLVKVLQKYPQGGFPLQPQDEKSATQAPKLAREMAVIDWTKPAADVRNQIRGLQPWPWANTFYNGKMLKITQAQVVDKTGNASPGQVIKADKNNFCVSCGTQALAIMEVQPEAGKLMPAASFVAGYKIAPGALLGVKP